MTHLSSKTGAFLKSTGVHFNVWAPTCKHVDVVDEQNQPLCSLMPQFSGYFSGFLKGAKEGLLYKFQLNHKNAYPDPCSNYQPQGPHGASMVINHERFQWSDHRWQKRGLSLKGQVFYELHVGTFTQQGTFATVTKELKGLKDLGITIIEIMPLAECPGQWNWGYDGVDLFAPYHVYGTPEDLKNLVNHAHHLGLGVILDVVYNHLGPDGNYLKAFSPDYFTKRYKNDWGEAINFDGPKSKESREFFIQNACYWIEQYHLDGLRLDATQNMYDQSKTHILAEISQRTRQVAAPKKIILIGENESQDVKLIEPCSRGGYGLDGVWNDDFHHAARVALTGQREAYYTDYLGTPQEFISLIKRGYLYQGQYYSWQKQNRGTWVGDDVPAQAFVTYLQNHDQVANSADGKRLHLKTKAASYRALTALTLLSPQTPLIFMGQEFSASSPFLFFTNHQEELSKMVYQGRKEFLSQFPSIATILKTIADPNHKNTFKSCQLNLLERHKYRAMYDLHKDLLTLRRTDDVFKQQDRHAIEGAVLGANTFVLRYKGKTSDRLVVVNLGDVLSFSPSPEALLAPRPAMKWHLMWSSNEKRYGGLEKRNSSAVDFCKIPARCTRVYKSVRI